MTLPGTRAAGGIRPRRGRAAKDRLFVCVCVAVTVLCVAVLAALLGAILHQGWKHLDLTFLNSFASRRAEKAGIKAAIWGSVWLCVVCAAVAIPLGVGTAIFLEEYRPRRRFEKWVHGVVQLNITNLAGVPSIVYGILGLTVFAGMFGLLGSSNRSLTDAWERVTLVSGEVIVGEPKRDAGGNAAETEDLLTLVEPIRGEVTIDKADVRSREPFYIREHVYRLRDGERVVGRNFKREGESITLTTASGPRTFAAADAVGHAPRRFLEWGDDRSPWYFRLPLGPSILAGGLTLALVILPIVIVATREALRAVPDSLREGAYALGATRLQMISRMILPASVPGVMTGAILAMSRAIGEAAPLLVVGGVVFVLSTPDNLMSPFAAMPLQIYNWAVQPQEEFQKVAASGIVVLLAVLLIFNTAAILIRQRFQRTR